MSFISLFVFNIEPRFILLPDIVKIAIVFKFIEPFFWLVS